MVQAQKGYFKENGQFVPESISAKIPVNRQVTIIWDEDVKEVTENITLNSTQKEAAQNFLTAIQKIRKELTAEDEAAINDLQSGKYKPL